MKKLSFLIGGLLIAGSALANTFPSPNCIPGQPQTNSYYETIHWYRNSAERNAIYREVFMWGQAQIAQDVIKMHLQSQKWGVVFDIDETLLDNSQLGYQSVETCQPITSLSFSQFAMTEVSTPLPGAAQITCNIQKMGGYVSLISNRDGSYVDPTTHKSLMQATIENLNKAGICYNQVILADGSGDKNTRFTAVRTGVYPQGMKYNNTLPAHPVVAYFGDNIQDFPNMQQAEMLQQDPNGPAYDAIGKTFFSLPNPTYGSWDANPFD